MEQKIFAKDDIEVIPLYLYTKVSESMNRIEQLSPYELDRDKRKIVPAVPYLIGQPIKEKVLITIYESNSYWSFNKQNYDPLEMNEWIVYAFPSPITDQFGRFLFQLDEPFVYDASIIVPHKFYDGKNSNTIKKISEYLRSAGFKIFCHLDLMDSKNKIDLAFESCKLEIILFDIFYNQSRFGILMQSNDFTNKKHGCSEFEFIRLIEQSVHKNRKNIIIIELEEIIKNDISQKFLFPDCDFNSKFNFQKQSLEEICKGCKKSIAEKIPPRLEEGIEKFNSIEGFKIIQMDECHERIWGFNS